jgi:hypothetical protein
VKTAWRWLLKAFVGLSAASDLGARQDAEGGGREMPASRCCTRVQINF